MEDFAAHVRAGLADANWSLRRDIIRALVKRIDVTDAHITVVFRVGARTLGPAPPHRPWPHWRPRLSLLARQARPRAAGRAWGALYRSAALPCLGL